MARVGVGVMVRTRVGLRGRGCGYERFHLLGSEGVDAQRAVKHPRESTKLREYKRAGRQLEHRPG